VFSPADEIVMVAGIPPIRARKARYFEDARFKERILPPPALTAPKLAWVDDWTKLPMPPPLAGAEAVPADGHDDDDPTESERRLQPELSLAQPAESQQPLSNEFELDSDHDSEADDVAARNRRLSGIMQGVARQASLDLGDGMEI
jgi:type IV secretion system protein VirD4